MNVKTSTAGGLYVLLRNAEFFRGISPASIEALAAIALPKTLEKNELLFTEGRKGHSFFLLASGTIQLSKNSADGKEVVIKIIGPGEIFGEVILFEKEIYPANAKTLERSLVYLIPKRQISCLLEHAGFRNDFIRMLMKKQRYLTDKILTLGGYDVEERLFRFLVERHGRREEYPIALSKKEVASAIGALPETLSRVLRRLGKRKVLAWSRKRIVLEKGFWEKNADLYG